jgi:hypothetical protein
MNNASYNENIGLGSITAGITLESEWYSAECKSVKDILDDMATISGCKWYIDNAKALNFVSEDTVTTANHTISATDTTTNLINDITVTEALENYANKVFVAGALGADGNILYVTAQLTSSITARAAIEGTANSSGVYGMVVSDATIDTLTAASTVADMYLKKYGAEPQQITFYSYETDWVAGTQVSANLPEFGMTAAVTCLIEEVTITSDANKILKSYVRCTKRDSANFSTQKSAGGVEFFEQIITKAKESGTKTKVFDGSGNPYVVVIYVQDAQPADAKAKTLWVDTDDYSRYDMTAITTTATLTTASPEYIKCSGAFTVTLHAGTTAGIKKWISNAGTASVTLSGTINETANYTLTAGVTVRLITDGANWRM